MVDGVVFKRLRQRRGPILDYISEDGFLNAEVVAGKHFYFGDPPSGVIMFVVPELY